MTIRHRPWAPFLMLLILWSALPASGQQADFNDPETLSARTMDLVFGDPAAADAALDWFAGRGDPDAAAAIIMAMRFGQLEPGRVDATLAALSGAGPLAGGRSNLWFNWMLWQQTHPEIVPNEAYLPFKLAVYDRIDPEFRRFFPPGNLRLIAEIRVEEMAWGGVRVDGIPPLDNPDMIPASEAGYLQDDDLVFGVALNGDVRAYPLRILGWHEMMNDSIGGRPVALAYCTLCGAGVLYARDVAHPDVLAPLTFSSTGMLYRSNKLMYDRQTNTVWDHLAGRPVMGKLRGSGIELEVLPMVTASWADWRAANPETSVVALDTGFRRDYGSGVVYADYFASADLMFPAALGDDALGQKERVFGLRLPGGAKAWPLSAFEGGRVINDRAGLTDVVLIGDAGQRTVRAYAREGRTFEQSAGSGTLAGPGGDWQITEDALLGPAGDRLARLPGHIAFWFAWAGTMGELANVPPLD